MNAFLVKFQCDSGSNFEISCLVVLYFEYHRMPIKIFSVQNELLNIKLDGIRIYHFSIKINESDGISRSVQ
jgi:hypothetical protein